MMIWKCQRLSPKVTADCGTDFLGLSEVSLGELWAIAMFLLLGVAFRAQVWL